MKIRFILPIFLVLLISCKKSGDFNINIGPAKEGKGKIIEKKISGEFDDIEVSQGIHAEIIKSQSESIVVSGPSDIIDKIVVTVADGKLKIGLEDNAYVSLKKVNVTIYVRDFKNLEANSSGSISCKDKFTQDNIRMIADSGGQMDVDLEANKMSINTDSGGFIEGKFWAVDLEVEANSAGRIEAVGKANSARFIVESGGSFDGKGFRINHAIAETSSGGSVILDVQQTLDANASSGGRVKVYKIGDLQILNKQQNSGGTVSISDK